MDNIYNIYFMDYHCENPTQENVIYNINYLYKDDIQSNFTCEKIDVNYYKILFVVKHNDDKIKKNYFIEIFEGGMLSYNIYDEAKNETTSGCNIIHVVKYEKKLNIFDNEINKIIDDLYSKIIIFDSYNNNPYDILIKSIKQFYKNNNFDI